MSSQYLTANEVIEVKAQNPDSNILSLDSQNIKKNADGNTFYIPVFCKRLTGNPTRCNLKFTKQIISGSAKIPALTKDADARCVNIVFSKLDAEDLEKTDYAGKDFKILLEENASLIQALDIISNEYESLVENEILNDDSGTYDLGKVKTLNSIRQTERKASPEEKEADRRLPKSERLIVNQRIPLPKAIYRIKLKADIKNGQKIGRAGKNGHQNIVFDLRGNKNATNPRAPVEARVKSKGKYYHLTTTNAKKFITYMSLTAGVIQFESVSLHSFGISLLTNFRNLYVHPHKQMKNVTLDENDIAEMSTMGALGYDSDVEEEVDEPEDVDDLKTSEKISTKSSNKKSKIKPTETEYVDMEPESNDSDDSDDSDDAENEISSEDDEVTTKKTKKSKNQK